MYTRLLTYRRVPTYEAYDSSHRADVMNVETSSYVANYNKKTPITLWQMLASESVASHRADLTSLMSHLVLPSPVYEHIYA